MRKTSLLFLLGVGLLVGSQAVRSQTPPPVLAPAPDTPAPNAPAPNAPATAPAAEGDYTLTKEELEGVENVFKMGPKIISGSCPNGEAGYASLARAGVKTIISVDGATPDVAMAEKYGMRYVHLPIEYGGVTHDQALRIAKAVSVLPGPIFIHCHHGIHRGPTAAVLAAIGALGWKKEQAMELMKQAGTDPKYEGLWAAARDFVPPTQAELDAVSDKFVSVSPIPPLAMAMDEIDERVDNLKAIKKANWGAIANQPDIDPPHEALILSEHFRELARQEEADKTHPADFLTFLKTAETNSVDLETILQAIKDGQDKKTEAAAAFDTLNQTCGNCHKIYRNNTINKKDGD